MPKSSNSNISHDFNHLITSRPIIAINSPPCAHLAITSQICNTELPRPGDNWIQPYKTNRYIPSINRRWLFSWQESKEGAKPDPLYSRDPGLLKSALEIWRSASLPTQLSGLRKAARKQHSTGGLVAFNFIGLVEDTLSTANVIYRQMVGADF
jgi:hypothetical protein